MGKITTRVGLKDYCFRRLGHPVIEINVDDDQVEDRIDDAFQVFFDHHYDGVERLFYSVKITQTDLDNKFITVPDSLIHVVRALPITSSNGLHYPMGDPSLAWNSTSASPLSGMGGGSGGSRQTSGISDRAGNTGFDMVGYYLQMSQLQEFEHLFGGQIPIRFSRHTNRVYLDADMGSILKIDDHVVMEGWATLDPDVYTDVYNDRWLKRYATAAIKKQWGANLIKYSGIALPGGVTLDGDKMFNEADDELDKLEDEIQLKYEIPVSMYMG